MKNKVYVTDDGQKIYLDRSVGVVLLIFTRMNEKWYILCNRRGQRTSECKLQWNLPSGYLDWDEDGPEAAIRETFEECGLKIPYPWVMEAEHSTSPNENRQNIIFRYFTIVPSSWMGKTLSNKCAEEDEVREIMWFPVDDLDEYEFAWKQDITIRRILKNNVMTLPGRVILEREEEL